MQHDYLVIDDDPTNNILCKFLIKKHDANAVVKIFSCPVLALEFLNELVDLNKIDDLNKTILLLDVNMPPMSGWDFLEQFENFPESLKNKFRVFILTSAIQSFDEEHTRFPFISEFLNKPFKKEMLLQIVEQEKKIKAKI